MLFLLQSDTTTVNNWPDYNVFGQFFLPVISFVFVCVLAYLATRWISGVKTTRGARTRCISIWDSMSIAYQKTLQIIKIGNSYYLIAITKDSITYLTEIPDTSISDFNDPDSDTNHYKGSFDKYLKLFLSNKNDSLK